MSERLFVRLEEDALHGPESTAPAGTLQAPEVPASLRECVAQLLVYSETLPAGVELVERVIPDGATRLVVSRGDLPSPGWPPGVRACVLGPSAVAAQVRLRGSVDGFSIALRPGASSALFGVPARELVDSIVPLEALWGSRATGELTERLDGVRSPAELGATLEAQLRSRWRSDRGAPARKASQAARRVLAARGRCSHSELASELGIGQRRLQQLFGEHIGLSPRTWARLGRIHGVLRALRRLQRPDWASLAVAHGFCDQAHLANEFRSFCGLTPTEYARRASSLSSKTRP